MSDAVLIALIGAAAVIGAASIGAASIGVANWLSLRKVKAVVDGPLTAALIRIADMTGSPADRIIADRAIKAADAADMKTPRKT